MNRIHRLDVLHEEETVFCDDDVRIQKRFWVECLLKALHERIGLLPPFHFDKRCHVAARTVFCFQRALEVRCNELADVFDKALILPLAVAFAEILRDDEVNVAVKDVTVDDAFFIAVVIHALAKCLDTVGKVVTLEGNVLDDDGGTDLANTANCREDARTDSPVRIVDSRIFRKLNRTKKFVLFDDFTNALDALLKGFMIICTRLDKNGSCTVRKISDESWNRRIILHGTERCTVEKLTGSNQRTRKIMNCTTGFAKRREIDKSRRLVLCIDDGTVGDFRNLCQRTL